MIDKPKGKGICTSWKEKLRHMIKEIAEQSTDLTDFFKRCTECGIEYVYTPRNKVKLKFRLKEQGQQRFTRADTLGEDHTPERSAEQIAETQKMRSAAYTVSEVKAPTPSKSIITQTQPTKPKTDYVYKPPTDDEFFKAFGVHLVDLDKPKISVSKPTESKSPEKKKDVWAGIRGIAKTAENPIYVVSFLVNDAYIRQFPIQHANERNRRARWIPADEVDILNQYLIGKSRLIASYQIDCSDGEVFFA